MTETDWEISGTYLESCNCDAICPCRTIGGRPGGRSTFGSCFGALSWAIERGHADGTDLSDLGVVLASRYEDDEPGSPWSFFLYLDERANPSQHEALEAIFTGKLGGTADKQFPWAWKSSNLLGVRSVPIDIDHTYGRGWFRAGRQVTVRISGPVPDQETVTCVIPGHHQAGEEMLAELLSVNDGPLAFELNDRCAYQSRFSYSSADS